MAYEQYEVFSKIKIKNPIDTELFGKIAEETARSLSGGKQNKSSQIRRFYDEIVLWSDKIESKDEQQKEQALQDALPYIRMLKAKLAYSGGRKLLSADFVDVFSKLVSQIDSPQTLKNAKLFFEAYLGFAKAFEENKQN